jgi:hypothetical protein
VTLIHGRHVGPLLTVWAAALVFVAFLYWVQNALPSLIDILTPLYVIVGIAAVIGTAKWFRERRYHYDRRHGSDRRRASRRHPQYPTPPSDTEQVDVE